MHNHCFWGRQVRLLPILLFLFASPMVFASDVLEHRISAHFHDEPIKAALTEIARQGGFEWSYNAKILDPSRRVTLRADGWTVRETLTVVLGDDYTFRQSAEYLILRKNKKPQQRLSGYLTDPSTGKKIPNATVYDRTTLRSTVSDSNGFYQLPVTPRSEVVIARLAYRDTVIGVTPQTPRFVRLDLVPDTAFAEPSGPSFRQRVARAPYALERFFVKTSQRVASLNVQDSLHRHFQLSFLPGIGTNGYMSGNVVNDWSVNILAGYSRGNRIAEFGGIGNIARENMTGLQAAGVFNNLGGNATGAQLAGVYNYVGDTLRGLQAAGVVNVAGYGRGVQAAGVLNLAPNGRFSVQAAGVVNVADTIAGAQGAGIWNQANLLRGVQASGAGNHARRAENAVQLAGLTNTVGDSSRVQVQVAGLANVADTVVSAQVAGLFNYAKRLHGVQIGIVNVARQNKGLQLGLVNLSKEGGYLAVEGSANDILPANFAFKSGIPGFHISLNGGVKPDSGTDKTIWAYGIGIGRNARFSNRLGMAFDLTFRHLNEGSHDDRLQEWAQFSLGLDLRVAGGLHLVGGPTMNVFASDPAVAESNALRDRIVQRNVLFEKTADGWLSGWVGWTAGVRWVF
ncbi:MAG: hypothetical protein ABMA02_14345 [Saprospiraceae bacterium]